MLSIRQRLFCNFKSCKAAVVKPRRNFGVGYKIIGPSFSIFSLFPKMFAV